MSILLWTGMSFRVRYYGNKQRRRINLCSIGTGQFIHALHFFCHTWNKYKHVLNTKDASTRRRRRRVASNVSISWALRAQRPNTRALRETVIALLWWQGQGLQNCVINTKQNTAVQHNTLTNVVGVNPSLREPSLPGTYAWAAHRYQRDS